MDQNQRLNIIIDCVAESLALDEATISAQSLLVEELGADSLDFMDIMFQLESAFSIKLQKEDFELLPRLGMSEAEAIEDRYLTPAAKQKLRRWLPGLPLDKRIQPFDLKNYITAETLALIVAEAEKNA